MTPRDNLPHSLRHKFMSHIELGATYSIGRFVQGVVNCHLYDQEQQADKNGRQDDAAVTSGITLLINQVLAAQRVSLSSESGLQACVLGMSAQT